MAVKPIPTGYTAVTPYLVVSDAPKLIDFMKSAFDAKEIFRMSMPDGSVGHAEMEIGGARVMLGQMPDPARQTRAMIHLYVPDTDATYQRALAAGATSDREPANQFYGDRSAGVKDPFGNYWYMATHVEDVSEEEMGKRVAAMKG